MSITRTTSTIWTNTTFPSSTNVSISQGDTYFGTITRSFSHLWPGACVAMPSAAMATLTSWARRKPMIRPSGSLLVLAVNILSNNDCAGKQDTPGRGHSFCLFIGVAQKRGRRSGETRGWERLKHSIKKGSLMARQSAARGKESD